MAEYLVCGIHAVTALLGRSGRQTRKLYLLADRQDKRLRHLEQLARNHEIPLEWLTAAQMGARFGQLSHQGAVAETEPPPRLTEADIPGLIASANGPALFLILDGVTDPHNLGACLRTADAVGVHAVIVPRDRSASLTPAAIKVASGAAESVPLVRVTNLARCLEQLHDLGIWTYGADASASTSLYELVLNSPVALVMGAEGTGLRRLTRERCDALFQLPMTGSVESLNVSVAAGVSLYEALRQRIGQTFPPVI